MIEEWRDIKGYEKVYQVSNLGRVRGLDRRVLRSNGTLFFCRGRIRKNTVKSNGYLAIQLRGYNEGVKNHYIHRLVAKMFLTSEVQEFVNHIDGNKENNTYLNLEYCNHQYNIQHAISLGLIDKKGSNHHNSKITEEDVQAIRKSTNTGKELASVYGISYATVREIITRRTWKHI